MEVECASEPEHNPGGNHHLAQHATLLLLPPQESLGTIEATVQAALDAEMPPSCKRTVYLCDDGKDKEKKAYIETLAHSGYGVE